MSLLKKLFGGGGSAAEPDPVDYNGYRITPTPMRDGNDYRVCARVEKDFDGETKQHELIRADTVSGLETAQEVSVDKAKQVIDAMGDKLFE
ncbi:MAG: HlyU family transcriptional regulator [Pseudomonadota bacterium]